MRFSVESFCSKCKQIGRNLRICSNIQKKSLTKNFIFCAVIPCQPVILTTWSHTHEYSFQYTQFFLVSYFQIPKEVSSELNL